MGLLVDGHWTDRWYDTSASSGRFQRQESGFRNWVTADGAPGPTGRGGFRAEPDRYHLYVALNCPWACRTLIYRKLKKLDDVISVSIAIPQFTEQGYSFAQYPRSIPDPPYNIRYLHQTY